jgi:NADH:ubiquinone oxidoreductase subunit 6 (subunit J)
MTSSEMVVNLLFYVFAVAAVAGALGVAASRNIVRSAFALLAVLFSAAALYALMKADFIAAAQVLIYVGGILVLIIFAVMLTHRITDVNVSNESTPGPAAFCAVLCLLFALVVIILPLPQPGPNKWDAGRAPETMREGPYAFVQYQADGKTGLANGGSTFENEVVVGVTIPEDRRAGLLRIVVRAVENPGKVKESLETKKAPDATLSPEKVRLAQEEARKTVAEPKSLEFAATPEKTETTHVRLKGLREAAYDWKVKLVGAEGESPWIGPKGDPNFVVHKGVTEPIALALADPYLLAFEAVSMLLLAALVGAAFLARKEVKE